MTVAAPRDTITVSNVIAGEERPAASGETFEKLSPATGRVISVVARSDRRDVVAAIEAAARAAELPSAGEQKGEAR